MVKHYLKTYFIRAFVAACIYCTTVVLFLIQERYQSVWLLFLGNALYMLAVATIIYFSNKAKQFNESSITSAVSGHILSFSGATMSVILSVLLYVGFAIGNHGEELHNAAADMSADPEFSMIFILIVVAALGNTISGFFAALFTSFLTEKNAAV